MQDQIPQDTKLERYDDHFESRTHWDWSGKRKADTFQMDIMEVTPGPELLTVAAAALSWWETHQHDVTHIDGLPVLRYPTVPAFVTHAYTVMLRAGHGQ